MNNILLRISFLLSLLLLFNTCELDEIADETPTFVRAIGGEGKQLGNDVVELPNTREYVIVGQGIGACKNAYIAKIDAWGNVLYEDQSYDLDGNEDSFLSVDLSSADNSLVLLGWSVETNESCRWVAPIPTENSTQPPHVDPWENVEGKMLFAKIPYSLNKEEAEIRTLSSNPSTEYTSNWDAGYGIRDLSGTYIITGAWGVHPALLRISASTFEPTTMPVILSEDIDLEIGEAKSAFESSRNEIVFTGKTTNHDEGVTKALFAVIGGNGIPKIAREKYINKAHAEGVSITETSDGDYILVGNAFDQPDRGGGGLNSPNGSLYLAKYNSNALLLENTIWTTPQGLSPRSGGQDIITVEDGTIITGYSYENGQRELLILKVDNDLNEVWHRTFAYENNDFQYGSAIIATADNGLLVIGETGMGTGDLDTRDVFVLKTNMEGEVID